MRQELLYLPIIHLTRMFLIVEKDELTYPAPIRLLGPHRIVPETHDLAHLLAQAQFGIGHQQLPGAVHSGVCF